MTSLRQRDEWTELARRQAAELRGWLGRRVGGPSMRTMHRLLTFIIMKLPPGRVLHGVGVALALFGWGSALAWPMTGLVSAWTSGFQLATTEFALGDPRDVAVDSHGRFYVVDSFHLRVQRYSSGGEFELGWFVPRKIFAVRTTADDRVVVGAEGGPRTYSSDGELIEVRPDQNLVQREDFAREPTGPYAVRRGLLPHVVDTRTGRTVIATPWPLRLIASPFPAFLYFAIGLAFLGLAGLREWCERKSETLSPVRAVTAAST
jgi:hypothetical protein